MPDERPLAVVSPLLSCNHGHLDDDDLISVDLQRAAAAGEPDPVGGQADLQALPVAGAIEAAGQPGEREEEEVKPGLWLKLLCASCCRRWSLLAAAAVLRSLYGLVAEVHVVKSSAELAPIPVQVRVDIQI